MAYYPAAASANLLQMHLYAGFNHLYARQGKAIANLMGEKMEQRMSGMKRWHRRWPHLQKENGQGMEMALHIGLTNWNSEDWRHPVRHVLRLPQTPRIWWYPAGMKKHILPISIFPPLVIEDFLEGEQQRSGTGDCQWRTGGNLLGNKRNLRLLLFSEKEGKTALQDCVPPD